MIVAASSVLGLFGLAIGSFLNVVIYRVPNGMSVVRPRSACPGCGQEIRARDNVPLVSWLVLLGRCRGCRMHISARYPLIEAITGAAFVVVALVWLPAVLRATTATAALGAVAELAAMAMLAAITIALSAIDLDVRRLPNSIVLSAFVTEAVLLAAAALLTGDAVRIGLAAAGAGAFVLVYGVMWFVYPNGMGAGDVKLSAVLGLVLGWFGVPQLVVGFAAAFLLGGIVGVVVIASRRGSRRTGIPFGPWMLLGAWIGIFAGAPVATAYLRLAGLG